ncbi:MAG: DsbA family protein [Flavobacteriales bacterium]
MTTPNNKRKKMVPIAIAAIVLSAITLFFLKQEKTKEIQAEKPGIVVPMAYAEWAPIFGDINAPKQVLIFSDNTCGFCNKFWSEQFAEVKKRFIDTGKCYLIWYDVSSAKDELPLAAFLAGAHEQGKSEQAIELLFKRGSRIQQPEFNSIAVQLGMDTVALANYLANPLLKDGMKKHFEYGKLCGVKGTPSFVIQGRLYSGFMDINEFERRLAFEEEKPEDNQGVKGKAVSALPDAR